jgi:hypothetical protein
MFLRLQLMTEKFGLLLHPSESLNQAANQILDLAACPPSDLIGVESILREVRCAIVLPCLTPCFFDSLRRGQLISVFGTTSYGETELKHAGFFIVLEQIDSENQLTVQDISINTCRSLLLVQEEDRIDYLAAKHQRKNILD